MVVHEMIGAPDQIAKEHEERLKRAVRPAAPVNIDDRWARSERTEQLLTRWRGLRQEWGTAITRAIADNQAPRPELFALCGMVDEEIAYIESLIEADNEDHQ